MTVTNYSQWVADGKPWGPARPSLDFMAYLNRHGVPYSVMGTIGNLAHLTASLPEDHCPYSHTPWPGPQPYPAVEALDVGDNTAVDWRWLGRRMVADKLAGHPALACLKYINWQDEQGNTWHDSWEPNHVHVASTDKGHLHISWRTDYTTSTIMQGYDPIGDTAVEGMLCKKGDTGPIVGALQSVILECGGNVGPTGVDLDYGPATAAGLAAVLAVPGNDGTNYGPGEYGLLRTRQTDRRIAIALAAFRPGGGLVPHDHPLPSGTSGPASATG